MLWPFGDLFGEADLDNLSAIHHRDPRRQIAHHRHGVRNKKVGQAELALQLRHQIHNLRPDAYIES